MAESALRLEAAAQEHAPAGPARPQPFSEADQVVREGLRRAAAAAAAEGMPALAVRGQLIRPLVAYAGAERVAGQLLREPEVSERFWYAVLAVQLAHEASLVHDDIVDGASTRRGEATAVSALGMGPALVYGDHLLTSAYRMAVRTGSPAFTELFARSVERTVAGEIAQAKVLGERLSPPRYREIAMGKSGELLGCALAAAPLVCGWDEAPALYDLGRRVGLLYQMLDDLLDYCPALDTGKPPLGDYRQRRWTWLLAELDDSSFGRDPEEVVAELTAPAPGGSTLRRCLGRLEKEAGSLEAALRASLGPSEILRELLDRWMRRAREGVERQEAASAALPPPPAPAPSRTLRERVPAMAEVAAHLGRNSRSFQFAARLFPRAERERIARVYAFCRVTDDLVDRPPGGDPAAAEELLAEWMELARRAYHGEPTGLAFLERLMGETAAAGVPFTYAAELAEGMRMDLRGESYASLAELRRYTYRVASVVGLWIAELFGVRDAWSLDRAAALGHAMQLTNILRDVGEDARLGRIYLPADALERHGLGSAELHAMLEGRTPILPAYAALVEELLQAAEKEYGYAFVAIPSLPRAAQPPVAVAAHVYRGIHAEIRRRGYDNLRQRASTSSPTKVLLAIRALRDLRSLPRSAEAMPMERKGGGE